MGPTWVLSAPDGPNVGPINLAIRESIGKISLIFKQDQSNVTDLIEIQIPCVYFKMTIAEPLLTIGWPFEWSIVDIYSNDWLPGITMKILWIISSMIQTMGQYKRNFIPVSYQCSYVSFGSTHRYVFISMNISKSLWYIPHNILSMRWVISLISSNPSLVFHNASLNWVIICFNSTSHTAKYWLISYQ